MPQPQHYVCRVVHPTEHLFSQGESNTTSKARLVCQFLKTLGVRGSSRQLLLQAGQAVNDFVVIHSVACKRAALRLKGTTMRAKMGLM